jgi:hypothetical protein
MRRFKNTAVMVAAIILCFASCCDKEDPIPETVTEDPVYNTGHPDHGKISNLTVRPANRADGVDLPAGYNVQIGDYTTTLQGANGSLNHLFPEGTCTVNIWNDAPNITVNGTIATADYTAGELGWFFSGSMNVDIKKDTDHDITVDVQQRVRSLTLTLDLKGDAGEHITDIDATLSGITGSINIADGSPVGDPVAVQLVFVQQPDGAYMAVIRLPGVTGDDQILSLTVHYDDGSTETITQQMHDVLDGFNSGVDPVNLKATLDLTAVIPDPARILHVTAPAFAAVTEDYDRPDAQPLVITNTGNRTATITGISVSPDNAFEINGSGNSVTAGESINTWTIQPKAGLPAGTYTATVTVDYDGTEETTATTTVSFTVDLRPEAILTVTAPTFMAVLTPYAQPAAKPLLITNTGNAEAIITDVSVSPGNAFEVGGSGSSVRQDERINTRTIRPKADLPAGAYTATVTVNYNGKTATTTVSFVVNNRNPMLSIIIPGFASVEEGYAIPDAQPLTLINTGNSTAHVTGVVVSSPDFIISGSGNEILPGESINTWTIQPKAGLPTGIHVADITVAYDGKTVSDRIYFQVYPKQTRILSITPPTFPEANVGYTQPPAQPIIITNIGTLAVSISSVTVSSTAFETGGSGSYIYPGNSISTWTIRPAANLPAGTYTATITVRYNGTSAVTATATVSFTVNAPAGFTGSISDWTDGGGGSITVN